MPHRPHDAAVPLQEDRGKGVCAHIPLQIKCGGGGGGGGCLDNGYHKSFHLICTYMYMYPCMYVLCKKIHAYTCW